MNRKQKWVSIMVTSMVIAFFAITFATARPKVCDTPLYTFRMEQTSSEMNFLPAERNEITYNTEKVYTLTGEAANPFRNRMYQLYPQEDGVTLNTCWETCEKTCSTCEKTCEKEEGTCQFTCQDTCNTCSDTCQFTCWQICDTSQQNTCGFTCSLTCNTDIMTCSPTCQFTCQDGCQKTWYSCSLTCSLTCEETCSTCEETCERTCLKTCEGTCKTCLWETCERTCWKTCRETCSTCADTCETWLWETCGGTCADTCEETCEETCETCLWKTCGGTCETCLWKTCEETCETCEDPCWFTESYTCPPEDFFSNVIIIVGSDAAAMDIVSATMLAAKISAMTSTAPDNLVMLDTELDFATWKAICDYNLILIGGPVANTIVEQLVENGISTADWAISPGGWEFIKAPYGGCDILIVAGADREASRAAAEYLITML